MILLNPQHKAPCLNDTKRDKAKQPAAASADQRVSSLSATQLTVQCETNPILKDYRSIMTVAKSCLPIQVPER